MNLTDSSCLCRWNKPQNVSINPVTPMNDQHKTKDHLIEELERLNVKLQEDITKRKQVEEELRESEEKYRAIFDNIGDQLTYLNKYGTIISANDHEATYGRKAEDIIGKNFSKLGYFDVKDISKYLKLFKDVITGKKTLDVMELKVKHKDGHKIPVEVSTSLVKKNGRIEGFLCIARDITKRKRAEEALRENERRYRQIIEEANDTVYTTDPNGYFTYVNPPTHKLTGYSRDELIGMHFTELIPQDWRDRVQSFYMQQRDKRVRDSSLEFPILTRTGEKKWVEQKVTMHTDGGRFTWVQSIVRDVTERKRAEELLRESEERFRALAESATDAIIFTDSRGTIIFLNRAGEAIFRYAAEELIGKPVAKLLPERLRDAFQEAMQRGGESGEFSILGKTAELLGTRKNGEEFPAEISFSSWQTAEELFYSTIVRDITERKRAEEELRATQEQLRNLSTHLQFVSEKERTNLAREIHDELGQALTALQIDLYWLGERVPVSKEDLIQKINSMSDIIEAVIQSTQRISTELRPVLLDTLGLSAAIEWQVEEFQKRTGIQCEVVIDSADIDLDPDRSTAIFRILQESLTNVARHADATEVWVGLNRHSDKLILEVVDNGKGITQDQISGSMAFGLIGMRERIRPWGGKFNICGIDGKGTTVAATISLDN